jgi:exonuclease V gamma subunit
VPLGELLDALDRTASGADRTRAGRHHNAAPAAAVRRAELRAAPGPFSFDPISHDAAVAAAGPRTPPRAAVDAAPAAEPADVALVDLLRMLEHPARASCASGSTSR